MRAALFTTLLALAGCAVGPDFKPPQAPDVTKYTAGGDPTTTTEADGHAQRFTQGADVVADWWHLFGSAAADAMVARAIADNPGLEAARANLRRSKDLMKAGYGVFFPQVDGQLGGVYQQATPLKFGQNLPATDYSLFTVAGTVSYTLDIWGGQRRQVEALGAQVDAQRYQLDGAFVMMCGNLVDTLIAAAAYRAQMDATRKTIELEHEQLRITEAQASGGSAPFANVLAIKTQIASTEALVPQLAQKVDLADHLLAALMGRTAGEVAPSSIRLEDFTLPTDVPVSLPSKLVRQRPDILVAEAQLHATNAQIGVAVAAMLPNLTLSAGAGLNNTSLANLADPASVFWSAGAGLTAPLFHGGTLLHQKNAAVDARDAAAATYRQTVLGAFEQVADTLSALQHDADALHAYKEANDSAEEALRLVQANYKAGIANYLQVIVANEQYEQARIAYLQSVAQRLQDTVGLYVALGGGWWNKAPT